MERLGPDRLWPTTLDLAALSLTPAAWMADSPASPAGRPIPINAYPSLAAPKATVIVVQ